jgi:hypothetical protein
MTDPVLTAYAADVRDLLGLEGWNITLTMVDDLPGDEGRYGDVTAICDYQEPYRIATIRLVRGRTIEEYRTSVMHELLHLALAPLDHAAKQVTAFLRPRHARAAREIIADANERTVSALTAALTQGIRLSPAGIAEDNPETEAPDGTRI